MTDPCTLGQWCFGLLSDFIVCKFDGGFARADPHVSIHSPPISDTKIARLCLRICIDTWGSNQRRKLMTQMRLTRIAIAVSTFAGAAMLSFGWSEQRGVSLSVEEAQARVGRPLTPVSVAGVARRQNRRAAYGYGVGAGVAGAAAVATAGAVAAATTPWGYNNAWGNTYAAQNDPRFGQPHYAARAYYGGAPYYGYTGWDDYSSRNFLKCKPGTMTKLDDGNMYLCQ